MGMIYKVCIIAEKWINSENKSVPVEIDFSYSDYGDVVSLIDSLINGKNEINIKIKKEAK